MLRLVYARIDQLDRRSRLQRVAHANALGQLQQPITARLRERPALDRRRGRAQHDGNVEQLCALNGKIARGIAHTFACLVRGIMLLIDHDDRELRHRTEDGESRTYDDARSPFMRRQPSGGAFGVCEIAVQCHYVSLGKRARNNDSSCGVRLISGTSSNACAVGSARKPARDRAQVDLGLAATRDPEQQVRRES